MSKYTRRGFLELSASLAAIGALAPLGKLLGREIPGRAGGMGSAGGPVVVSTWSHGIPANDAAWKVLAAGGTALDAVEAGVRVPEGDPSVTSVGYGGYPDEDCRVTLDACIMGPDGRCGSTAFVEGCMHPISLARKVMEETDHVMIVGAGAEEFARRMGFPREDLLTEHAREVWLKWKSSAAADDDWLPVKENHDTIGMVALDSRGDLAGACTTSGLAFKIHGRVGDSPIIGAGMYVDNEVGAAAATGRGEAVIRICGSFLVVENMRSGMPPEQACRAAVERIVRSHGGNVDFQVGFVAVNKSGETGAFGLTEGFDYAVADGGGNVLHKAPYLR